MQVCDGTRVVVGSHVQGYGDRYEENTWIRTSKIFFLASGCTEKFISYVLNIKLINFW